jgi:hypothetical protein
MAPRQTSRKDYEPFNSLQDSAVDCRIFAPRRRESAITCARAPGRACWFTVLGAGCRPGKAEPNHMDIPTGAAKSHESHPHRCFRPVWCQT